jgi:hypothetical protein
MSLLQSTSQISKKTKQTKKTNAKGKKKLIENKVLNIVNNNLPFELSYDMTVEEEFKSSVLERDMSIHMDIINKLPTFKVDFKTRNEEEDAIEKKTKRTVRIKPIVEDNEEDEYMKNLPIEKVGSTQYKFDYDKGIIYDMKDNEVGHIDSYGEICINGEEPADEDENSNQQDENI